MAKKTAKETAVRKGKRHPNRPLTEAQTRILLSSLDDIRDDARFRLGLSVGMRVSSVSNHDETHLALISRPRMRTTLLDHANSYENVERILTYLKGHS